MKTIVELEHLTKTYGRARGITDLSLKVEQGDVFGFIGPNGAGKSTTIRTMLGLISANEGTVRLFGKSIKDAKKEILQETGYMPSEAMFYSGMRVEEIIKMSARLYKKDCKKTAEELCSRLQLDTKKKIEDLSLGNRKKVSIVCALQHEPQLYILDEPTSGLDPLMQKEFFALLKERNQKGAAIFLSSHVLSEIEHHCRHAAIIREGRILVCDTVENLAKTSARRVHITGINRIEEIPGMSDIRLDQNQLDFLYQGEIPRLIQALQGMSIQDITITEPDLEEIFLHFYERAGEL